MTKLVRDKIPDVIRSKGDTPITRTASREEYHQALDDKLTEEIREWRESGDPEELADVMEVVHALANTRGISASQLEEMRAAKHEERGGFSAGIIWEGNAEREAGA